LRSHEKGSRQEGALLLLAYRTSTRDLKKAIALELFSGAADTVNLKEFFECAQGKTFLWEVDFE